MSFRADDVEFVEEVEVFIIPSHQSAALWIGVSRRCQMRASRVTAESIRCILVLRLPQNSRVYSQAEYPGFYSEE